MISIWDIHACVVSSQLTHTQAQMQLHTATLLIISYSTLLYIPTLELSSLLTNIVQTSLIIQLISPCPHYTFPPTTRGHTTYTFVCTAYAVMHLLHGCLHCCQVNQKGRQFLAWWSDIMTGCVPNANFLCL